MSLYRQAGGARRRRALGFGLVGAVAVVALVVVLAALGGGSPSEADRARKARAGVSRALDGLELVGVEYRQAVRGGRVVAPTEYAAARSDVARARAALADLALSRVARAAQDALARVATAVDDRVAPRALARTLAAARRRVVALSRPGGPAAS